MSVLLCASCKTPFRPPLEPGETVRCSCGVGSMRNSPIQPQFEGMRFDLGRPSSGAMFFAPATDPGTASAHLASAVRKALDGIDRTQDDCNGWWETSIGADFGRQQLASVIDLILDAGGWSKPVFGRPDRIDIAATRPRRPWWKRLFGDKA